MNVRRIAAGRLILSTALAGTLVGCAMTPMGPSVQVLPGRGKSFETFTSDQSACKAYAAEQVKGQAEASNNRAAGAVLLGTLLGAGLGAAVGGAAGDAGAGAAIGAATGVGSGTLVGASGSANDQAAIQQQYDNAFSQCMFAKGEQVTGVAPVASIGEPGAPVAQADPLVRSTQSELIRLGYLHDTADGFAGPRTHDAIVGFEQNSGLPVDGSVSPSLLARLQSTPTMAPTAAAPAAPSSTWVQPTTTKTP